MRKFDVLVVWLLGVLVGLLGYWKFGDPARHLTLDLVTVERYPGPFPGIPVDGMSINCGGEVAKVVITEIQGGGGGGGTGGKPGELRPRGIPGTAGGSGSPEGSAKPN